MSTSYHSSNVQMLRASSSSSSEPTRRRNFPAPHDDSKSDDCDWDMKLSKILEDLQMSMQPQNVEPSSRGQTHLNPAMDLPIKSYRQSPGSTSNSRIQETYMEYKSVSNQSIPVPFYLSPQPQSPDSESEFPRQNVPTKTRKRSQEQRNPSALRHYFEEKELSRVQYNDGLSYNQQMQYMDACNTVTILKSEESSPLPPPQPEYQRMITATTPKTRRRDHYSSNTSYTQQQIVKEIPRKIPPKSTEMDFEFLPPQNYPPKHVEFRPESPPTPTPTPPITNGQFGNPLCSSTPKPGSEFAGPTKFQHRNESYKTSCRTMLNFDEPDYANHHSPVVHAHVPSNYIQQPSPTMEPPIKFYTATTTRTETRARETPETQPVARIFPSQVRSSARSMQNGGIGEPPKRLDELLATFDQSFIETSKIVGDGGGPHKSHPYGPGTHPIQRSVRINESANIENQIMEKQMSSGRSGNANNTTTTNFADPEFTTTSNGVPGPPVYYPIPENEQLFTRTNAQMQMFGTGSAKMERTYNENSKYKHSEKSGGGALPVPVCLPVCCAAPCVIL